VCVGVACADAAPGVCVEATQGEIAQVFGVQEVLEVLDVVAVWGWEFVDRRLLDEGCVYMAGRSDR
jgi:hypothetical protein